MRLRRCAHGNLLRSTHERARMRCMGGLTAAHLRLAALSCSRCEQLPKTLLADAARERRAPAFLARVSTVNSLFTPEVDLCQKAPGICFRTYMRCLQTYGRPKKTHRQEVDFEVQYMYFRSTLP